MRRNGGLIGVETTTSTSEAKGIFDSFDVYNARLRNSWPEVAVFVSISPAANTSFNEGDTFTVEVVTEGVVNGTELFYDIQTISGNVNSNDFTDGETQGSFIINNNQGSFSKTFVFDAISEPDDVFVVNIRTGSVTGPIVLTSGEITILNPVFNVTPSSATVNEGSTVTFNINTENVNNQTLFYTISGSGINQNDFVSSTTGSFSLTSNSGSVSITTREDLITEGDETFTFFVRLFSTSGPVVAQTNVTIIDTSITPSATIVPNTTSVDEGSSVTFTINMSGYNSGPVDWTVVGVSGNINPDDFTDEQMSGTETVSSSTATVTRTLTNDLLTEGEESFKLEARITRPDNSVVLVGTSPTVTINDTSVTPTAIITPDVTSIDEGETVTFAISTTGFESGTLRFQINEVTGNIRSTDFTIDSTFGTVSISGSSGTLSLTAAEDTFDEGPESFSVSLIVDRPDGSSAVIGTSDVVTINDTSTGGGPEPTSLYEFTSFTFTNGTQTGSEGPSLQNLLSAYDTNENPWLNNTEFFNTSDGIQLWTVPDDGTYRIRAYGAGNTNEGRGSAGGAVIEADFDLIRGEVFKIVVGQEGLNNGNSGGGGGGSFFVRYDDVPYLIAGGAGGHTGQAQTGTSGSNNSRTPGSGGPAQADCAGGGGFITNGDFSGNMLGGKSFLNGAQGGGNEQSGGFGGGGDGRTICCRNGGGGGYSGGSGHTLNGGGFGGGSFISIKAKSAATSDGNFNTTGNEPHDTYEGSISNLSEFNTSNGKVEITRL